MKRYLALTLVFFSTIAFLSSCEKAPFVTTTGPRSYNFTRQGGTQTFAFSCNRDWSVSSTESWIRISPSSGAASDGDITVTITCSPNTTYDPRSATVTLKVEELTETISISQDTGLGLIVSQTNFDLTNEEQIIEVEVKTNIEFEIFSDAEWIKKADTKALSSSSLAMSIQANLNLEQRTGTVTIRQKDGDLSSTIVIKQEADVPIIFADLTTKKICVERWDMNRDGELSVTEAKMVSSLGQVFKESNISSFDEFKYFKGITTIEKQAFLASKIKSIVFPESITSVEMEAFLYCTLLSSLSLNEGLTTIGDYAFQTCYSLQNVVFPESLQRLGMLSFSATALSVISIPDGLTSFGEGVFSNCTSLREFRGINTSSDHRCLIVDGVLVAFAPYSLTSYDFPDTISKVTWGVFNSCTSLIKVSFSKKTTIFDGGFSDCSSLQSISFEGKGEGLETVPTFQNCQALTVIDISKATKIKEIPQRFLYRCANIGEITIPVSVETINPQAFLYCSSLKTVICQPTTPPILLSIYSGQPDVFSYTNNNLSIYVPASSLEEYKNAYTWQPYANRIKPIQE